MADTLLPPNASPLERGLEQASARQADVPVPISALWRPEQCPSYLLPWLAWAVSVDAWDPDWPEEARREAVARSIALHRRKGTAWAVRDALERLGAVYDLTELTGGKHHRMAIAVYNSGALLSAGVARVREQVDAARRASVHYTLTLVAGAAGEVPMAAGAGAASVCTAPLTLEVRA